MNSQQQGLENRIKELQQQQSRAVSGARVAEIATHVAFEVLEEFAQALKNDLAAGATVTPLFIEDAVKIAKSKLL